MSLWYKIKSFFVDWFSNIRIYKGGIILFGRSGYKLKGPVLEKVLDIIKPGDVLLRRYDHYMGTHFIPGYYSHAGLYVGGSPLVYKGQIIHMLGDGICEENVLDFLKCDSIAILRPHEVDLIPYAIKKAYCQLSKRVSYDFNFNKSCPKRFYCTELVAYCYDYPKFSKILMKNIILPDDMMYSIWEKIYEWRNDQKNE